MRAFVVLLGCVAMIGLILGLTINSSVDPVPLAPMQFESTGEDSHFLQRVCPCKNDWPIATNERLLSNELFSQTNSIPDERHLSVMTAFFGQFIDHDVIFSRSNNSDEIFSIEMTPFDAILNLTRVVSRKTNGCLESEQLRTSMIDASTVYGDALNPKKLDYLRVSHSCKMKMLPLDKEKNEFITGDERATEHPFLSGLHALWVAEHNRLCDQMPSTMSADEQFWKARQIVIAKIQHITYTEWLPALMGSQFQLVSSVPTLGQGTRITMEYATVAFRFGHSMVADPIGPFALPGLFFNPQVILENGLEPIFMAAITTPAQKVDTKVVDGLRNFLFSMGPNTIGEDLVTRNLFRQRELGIGTYQQLVNCYHGVAHPLVDPNADSFIGLLSEPLVPGSSLPRNLALILAEQFKRLRWNDDRFYTKIAGEIGNQFWQEVITTTLGKVIALNTGLASASHTKVFFL